MLLLIIGELPLHKRFYTLGDPRPHLEKSVEALYLESRLSAGANCHTAAVLTCRKMLMHVAVEKAAPNYTQTTPAQPVPSIDTQRAVTSVLMDDGETTVIGGIYTREESDVSVRTPFLHRVPLLGWLFKSDRHLDDSDELLIFITPRIAR